MYPKLGLLVMPMYDMIKEFIKNEQIEEDELSEKVIDFLVWEGLVITKWLPNKKIRIVKMPDIMKECNKSAAEDKQLKKAIELNSEIDMIAYNLMRQYGLISADELARIILSYI